MVEDVHRRAAPRRRWTLPVVGLGVALLFGFVGTHPYPVEAPRTAVPTPEETFGDGLPRVTGARTSGPEGLRLLVSGAYPQVVDAHSGRGAAVPGLRLGRDEGAQLQLVPGGLVATVGSPTTVRRRSVLLRAGGGRPVLLGDDVRVTPTWRGTELVVSSFGPGGTSVQLTEPSGTVRRFWVQPGLVTPLRDTRYGLLVLRAGNAGVTGGDLALLEPGTGVLRRRLAAGRIAVAVGPAAVAHVPAGCGRDCPLTITDLATGRSRDYRMPDEGIPSRGEFSPDGRRLALGVPGQYLNGRLTIRPGFIAVLELASGEVRRVAGVETPAERTADLSWWGPDRLVLGIWWDDRARVALWSADRPADPAGVLEVEPPGSYQYSSVAALP